ncbi:STT3 domain-containing protein [Sulfurimonas sp.]|uniref:STT3 domain-containing protein n=1 Tax=Sulfurimonas sp. TaxID=2022749 RepID=UPI0025EEE80F|nr:STT3 domain-containing protein [Sulfurimonas sp.]MDD5157202.1 STT3 domain-containing protein [Sulfurimonas sp.]
MSTLTRETKLTLLYIFIALLFSIAARMIWYYQFYGYEPFIHDGQFMINTNDGYYWAEGARDILAGHHELNDLSPVTEVVSKFAAFFAYILPFSFETIILFMPMVLGSLVVIPIILIGKSLKNLELGFIAALLASIANSYYNRTMIGYFDTDMLNIVLPMFLLWSIIWAIKTDEEKYLLITALDILVYRLWYPQSYSLELSFFTLILFYVLVFDRKNLFNYKLLAIMMIAMLNIDIYIRFPLITAIYFVYKQNKFDKFVYYILGVSIILFFVSGGFNPVWDQLKGYVFKDALIVGEHGMRLHFFSVMQTVREAGHIPFEVFAQRISGSVIVFALSIVGYIYLVFRHKVMLIAIPLIGLGFLASVGGLRFTIYAVPILAFGVAFLITEVARFIPNIKIKILTIFTLTVVILSPNIQHIVEYRVPTVFNSDEVKVLEMLKAKASREDYVVAWWDFGYPIRYYADMKTLIDGGKHDGSVNFPVSFMLTNPAELSAKIARLDVEYTEKGFKKNAETNETATSNIEQISKDYGYDDTNDFLYSLQTDIKLPQKTRDIYFYLPFRMLSIYSTVASFSNINLMNGEMGKEPNLYSSNNFEQKGDIVDLGNGFLFNTKEKTITVSKEKIPLKRFVQTGYDKELNFSKRVDVFNESANLSIIYMSSYNTFLVLDEKTYNSLYIQLMVLEEYNKSLFELVVQNPHAKVYKLKI